MLGTLGPDSSDATPEMVMAEGGITAYVPACGKEGARACANNPIRKQAMEAQLCQHLCPIILPYSDTRMTRLGKGCLQWPVRRHAKDADSAR